MALIRFSSTSVSGPLSFPFGPKFPEVSIVSPYVWLYEIEVPKDPPTRLRLTSHTVEVEWGTNSSGAINVYSPFPIGHRDIREDSEGSIPTTVLSVSNVTLEMQQYVQTYDMIDQPVRIMLVRWDDAPNGTPIRQYDFRILALRTNAEAFTATLGNYNLNRQPFPLQRCNRDFCGWGYKGPECGYTGVEATCDKTLEGSNGCKAKGNQARFEAFNLPRSTGGLGG